QRRPVRIGDGAKWIERLDPAVAAGSGRRRVRDDAHDSTPDAVADSVAMPKRVAFGKELLCKSLIDDNRRFVGRGERAPPDEAETDNVKVVRRYLMDRDRQRLGSDTETTVDFELSKAEQAGVRR